MWKNLSLRARLFLPLGVLFLTALLLGASALQVFSPAQFVYENEPERQAAQVVAHALNGALESSASPQQALDAFAASLGTASAIRFRPIGAAGGPPPVRVTSADIPKWFVGLLTIPELGAAYPISIQGRHVGDILFSPDISADVFEKWVGFLAITVSAAILMLLTAAIAYFIAGAVLRPLLDLGNGLTRMRAGRYDETIPVTGPLEIQRSCMEANELASTLSRLSDHNGKLLYKIVSLKDDERQRLARELHDELGPLLFSIRADSTVLLEAIPGGDTKLDRPLQGLLKAVEALQLANRRILEGLHPLYLHELGLERSIQSLLQNTRSQAPNIRISSHIDPDLNRVDDLLSQTVYRVIQEGITNVLRHAMATSIFVEADTRDAGIVVEVSDNGIGLAAGTAFGRGLRGMDERVRALGGSFELLRKEDRTIIRCLLPFGSADATASKNVNALLARRN
jgi:two-component system, NarL family, sensor histidine kinase UhpB